MSLPPGFLDELRTRTSLSQVVGRKVMWDQRMSNQGKGDMWAPCPFHQEKTASFHVDDRKGYYYCFGCHAKGDAISFIRETENVGFMEAVEILAQETGMPMPARDPKAQEKADRRTLLVQVMEQAVQYFRLQLKTGAAAAARDYLAGRGLSEPVQERWEIGFAPDAWQGLWDHLIAKDVAPELILAAGLAKPSQKGGKPYDTFRGRIIFPIRDARGRAIAFGGRAMDPNDNAKYLNSPETELFDKGRTLFNHGPAREAAGKGQPLIVAEGYMDVIALSEAGFGAAVAPLGTAITDNQLHLLWRVANEPIIALDGDTAGLRAAHRSIDLALPLLEAGKSLRFALMPAGKDPDDVIRAGGAGAMTKLLDAAQPMVQLLWSRETEGKVFDSPERKAALDKDLRTVIARIQDPSIRGHYGEEIKRLRWDLFGQKRGAQKGKWRPRNAPAPAQASTRASTLVAATEQFSEELREAVILALLIRYPGLMPRFESQLEELNFTSFEHQKLQNALLQNHAQTDPAQMQSAIEAETGPAPLENLFSLGHVQIVPALRAPGNEEAAQLALAEAFAKLIADRAHESELSHAEAEMAATPNEALTWHLRENNQARDSAMRGDTEDRAEYDTLDNGARLVREERERFRALLAQLGMDESNSGGS